jgi:excisionase family DNA binding protein
LNQMENPDWKPEPLLLSVCQVAVLIGVSERTVKNLLAHGELVRRKVGRRTLVPRSSVMAFLKRDHATKEQ